MLNRAQHGGCRTLRDLACGVLALSAWPAIACTDPQLHPEMAEFFAVMESLSTQEPPTVQVMFLVERGAGQGQEAQQGQGVAQVRLSFWPLTDFERDHFIVTPSAGLELVEFHGARPMPGDGEVGFTVRVRGNPAQSVPYLRLETVMRKGSDERHHTLAIPMPFGIEGIADSEHSDGLDDEDGEPGGPRDDSLASAPVAPSTATP